MYSVILVAHIAGAVVTGFAGITAIGAMALRKEHLYRPIALALAAIGSFEVASGTALAVLSKTTSVASVCGDIALYVGAVAFVETLIFMRMRKSVVRFPSVQTVSAMGGSIALLALAGVLGF